MKLMKSFLTLLLLGGMTFAGCDKAKSGDEPAGETPSGETPSGETPSGETPSGGGESGTEDKFTVSFDANGGTGTMASVSDVSGEYTLPACTLTAPEGKEFDGWKVGTAGEVKAVGEKITVTANVTLIAQWKDIPAPANHFDDKRIDVKSIVVDPTSAQAAVEDEFGDAYVCLISEGSYAALVNPSEDGPDVMYGTYEISTDGTKAELSIDHFYSFEYEETDVATGDDIMHLTLEFANDKYTVEFMVEEGITATFTAEESEYEPSKVDMTPPPYIYHGVADGEWKKFALEEDSEVPGQVKGEIELAENEMFVVRVDGGTWLGYGAYSHDPDTAGGKLIESDDGYSNLKATEAGVYKVFVNSGSIYVVHDTEVTYKFWLKNKNVMDGNPEYYAWVWNSNDEGHWVVCTVSYYNETEPYLEVTLPSYIVGAKIVRCNPAEDSEHTKPTEGSTEYGNPNAWNSTGNITLSRVGGDVDVSFW